MKFTLIILTCLVLTIILSIFLLLNCNCETVHADKVLSGTWSGYRKCFIEPTGRVKRPKDKDTVSEGQAYAMLRAAWMKDKDTFDRCYIWTEENLSRAKTTGDSLLSWHWKEGQITDLTPASDADIDYALALIFADSLWHGSTPSNTEDYGRKALTILGDILELETYSTSGGRLYLSPWPIDKEQTLFAVNPSYYSPAHFRIFYSYTKDQRWLDLLDTAYYVLERLQNEFDGQKGLGLIPDWCSVDKFDNFAVLKGKGADFGYESIRIPFRVGLDRLWFNESRARKFLDNFSKFITSRYRADRKIFCEYAYDGTPAKRYESPAFYSCYYYAADEKHKQIFLDKTREYLISHKGYMLYVDPDDYYINSLGWLAEGADAAVIKDLFETTD